MIGARPEGGTGAQELSLRPPGTRDLIAVAGAEDAAAIGRPPATDVDVRLRTWARSTPSGTTEAPHRCSAWWAREDA